MSKLPILAVVAIVVTGGAAFYTRSGTSEGTQTGAAAGQAGQGAPGGRAPGAPGGGVFRAPMTVELAPVSRSEVAEQLTIVGNLIGAATVEVVPKVNGRLETVSVRIGDRVAKGQRIAKVEDSEIHEQVKQAQAAFDVARATVRQREADLTFAETAVERSRNLFNRQLLPKQTLDDSEARYQAASAQIDLTRAQFAQAQSRLDELQINLANTEILSPVDGFVGKRYLDPGAFVGPNAPVASVVDIHFVRLITNIVEKDLKRVQSDVPAIAEVDAFPGEEFTGKVARVSPVLDPATRTAQMEIELTNPGFRLKPGMYARVRLTVETRPNALVVPRNAVVDLEGKRGVFVAAENTASFRAVETGLEDQNRVEIRSGVTEGDKVVTTGAAALKDGDRILLAGQNRGPGDPGGPGGPGGPAARPGGPGTGEGRSDVKRPTGARQPAGT